MYVCVCVRASLSLNYMQLSLSINLIYLLVVKLLLVVLLASNSEPSRNSLFSNRSAVMAFFLRGFIGVAIAWSWRPLTLILACELLLIEVQSTGQELSTTITFVWVLLMVFNLPPVLDPSPVLWSIIKENDKFLCFVFVH